VHTAEIAERTLNTVHIPRKEFGVFETAGGPEIGESNIITQAIKLLAGRLSAERNVITLAITSRQQTSRGKAKERMQVHQKSKAGTASHRRTAAGLRTACLTSGSNRSLRSLGRAKARPLTKR
jgi:hypothetical protein